VATARSTEDGAVSADGASARDVVRRGYDAIGAAYHAWSHASPVRLQVLDQVLARLTPGSRVVDLGCGPGDPATRLLAESHHVIGVDISAGQLALARRHAPRASLVQADLAELALAPASVDAVVSFFATGHLPPGVQRDLPGRVARWLRPGGLFVTSAPLSAGEGVDAGWLGAEMYFAGIGEAAMVAAVGAAGLLLESAVRLREDAGDGRVEEFLWITATRPAAG
jgi:SAM-dependent methyltransferase